MVLPDYRFQLRITLQGGFHDHQTFILDADLIVPSKNRADPTQDIGAGSKSRLHDQSAKLFRFFIRRGRDEYHDFRTLRVHFHPTALAIGMPTANTDHQHALEDQYLHAACPYIFPRHVAMNMGRNCTNKPKTVTFTSGFLPSASRAAHGLALLVPLLLFGLNPPDLERLHQPLPARVDTPFPPPYDPIISAQMEVRR